MPLPCPVLELRGRARERRQPRVLRLRAHTEWEQIQRAEERDGRIVDLLSRTSSDGAGGDRIEDEALGARAARVVLDELIDRALASGSALLAAPAHEQA
ncbi:hypothetical protein ACFXKD_10775 [Nocardiopsis aegyptia]|uniref:hypothetical protein n=1 Tax=Nocardiopsis aegyptia TaxID=220378 RepID=UPI00366B4321